jgi:hypothetical protein
MKDRGDNRQLRNRKESLFKFKVFMALAFHVIYPTEKLANLNAESHSYNLTVNTNKTCACGESPVTANQDWFSYPAFISIIKTHDQYLPELTRWRNLFAQHAKTLARVIKTFPGSENLSQDDLRRIITNQETTLDTLENKDVFAPWTNRWSGVWSNGALQYHIWDSTRVMRGRMIQPVTLSESSFTNYCCVERMAQSGKTDVAINVFSREHGITGWVSKNQRGRVELPHVGYLINDTTLVWLCQIKEPGKLSAPNNRWFIFLETVNTSANPAEYRIYGQPVVIMETVVVESDQRGKHYGTYYSTKLSRAASASGNFDFPGHIKEGGHGT